MIGKRMFGRLSAVALLFCAAGITQAQPAGGQPPAGGGPPPSTMKVLVAGENPAIRYLDKEGGKAISSVNFWRVHWSPVGPGTVCFVTITDQGADNLRIAIFDDQKVLDYVTKELMSSLTPTFNTPPFTALKGTVTQTNDGAKERKETCKSDRYTVELVWKSMGDPFWVEFKPGSNTLMTFAMVPAANADIIINGKKAPGTLYPTGGGLGPGAFLAVNETWRR
jgi:hypothetical protein